MRTIQAIAASSGIAIAKAYILEDPDLIFTEESIEDPTAEIERLAKAIQASKKELEAIRAHTKEAIDEEHAEIFSAHILILEDPEFIGAVEEAIRADLQNAETCLSHIATSFIEMFGQMDNPYMQERAADIKDVTERVLAHLLHVTLPNPALIEEEVILIADDLTPSDTAQLDRTYVKAFATNIGGRTSHSAIMARSLEIPAVVGASSVTSSVAHGEVVIVDGTEGRIITQPTAAQIASYEEKRRTYEAKKAMWARLKDEPSVSKDGHQVELAANIGTPEDVDGVIEHGGEGVGLYRTEFLYMGKSKLPTEDEQFDAYKKVLEKMDGKPVVVRTLDIGGDKDLTYMPLPSELNPFLGQRAIRYCLANEDIFRPQLRALLRASVYGNLKIMFPMIATLEEFRQAKGLLEEEKETLLAEGVEVADTYEVGIMVEIPSTAMIAQQFAKEVDFFSIGTNDLIQYTMAADRMNEQVSYLYQPYHPAILQLIANVIKAAHAEGKWVGMCGEMAGDPVALPILLGLGLDEFSMSASSILRARTQLKETSKEVMESHIDNILQLGTADEVGAYVEKIGN